MTPGTARPCLPGPWKSRGSRHSECPSSPSQRGQDGCATAGAWLSGQARREKVKAAVGTVPRGSCCGPAASWLQNTMFGKTAGAGGTCPGTLSFRKGVRCSPGPVGLAAGQGQPWGDLASLALCCAVRFPARLVVQPSALSDPVLRAAPSRQGALRQERLCWSGPL